MENPIPSYTIESLKSTDTQTREFDFFRFEYFAKDIEHLKAPHRHHFYTFILVTGGGGSHAIDFHSYDLVKGRLFLIAPGQVHAWIDLQDVKGFVVLFTDSFMALSKGRKLMSAWPLFKAHQPAHFDLTPDELSVWINKFQDLEKEHSHPDEFSRDAIFYSISTLLVRTSRLLKRAPQRRNMQRQNFLFSFQELIEANYLKIRLPRHYAERMNLTPNYLNALCKKESGKSSGELIRQRILLEAKRLLAHTRLSVSEIAFKLGFEDNAYFGAFFKKYTTLTPGKFRDAQNR